MFGLKSVSTMTVRFPSQKARQSAEAALSHESKAGSRSTAKLTGKGDVLMVEIEAQDVVALRATLNAYLRALQVFESIEASIAGGKAGCGAGDDPVENEREGSKS